MPPFPTDRRDTYLPPGTRCKPIHGARSGADIHVGLTVPGSRYLCPGWSRWVLGEYEFRSLSLEHAGFELGGLGHHLVVP